MNKFPKYPDNKFYIQEPSLEEKRKYMPDMDNDGRIHKEVKNKELYKLIVSDILEVKYKDTKKCDLNKLNINRIDNWISLFHESHYGFCYYEINNGLIGILYKDEDEDEENNYNGLKLIYNYENDIIYEIYNDIL